MRSLLCGPRPALVVGVLAVGAYLLGSGVDVFPMDDSYIHFTYARNLAELGRLTFNPSPPDPGVGTSSILWTLLLALGQLTIGVPAAARLLGLAAYLAVIALSWRVARWMIPTDRGATLATCLVALSGNLIWFSLSGMETMLFVALGLGAVVAYRHRRFAAAGLLAGLCALTRIEGVVLLAGMLAVELTHERRARREMVAAVALAMLLLAPWLAYLQSRTGHLLPTTFAGKKQAQVRAALEIVGEMTGAAPRDDGALPWWAAGIYPAGALGYGLAFVAGGAYLPGPRFTPPGELFEMIGGLSLLGLAVALGVFLPLVVVAVQRAVVVVRAADPRHRALALLAVWLALHNLAYWAKLPTPGTASRYQVLNHLACWLLLGAGVAWWRTEPKRREAIAALLLLLGLANGGWWRAVYQSNTRHMAEVRFASADWIATRTPADAVIAAHDIGALGWRMERRCVDLGGLIDGAWLEARRSGRIAEFLRDRGATHLVLPDKHSSETAGFYDYAEFLGLTAAPGLRYVPLTSFENDYASWLRGAAPTWNALPAVTVYRLEYER